MSIEGKVALVKGSSGGLVSVYCLSLANAGCYAAVAGHNHEADGTKSHRNSRSAL